MIVIHPGEVESVNDGERHYITTSQLMRIYGIGNHHQWIATDSISYRHHQYGADDKHLYPRANGNYFQVPVPSVVDVQDVFEQDMYYPDTGDNVSHNDMANEFQPQPWQDHTQRQGGNSVLVDGVRLTGQGFQLDARTGFTTPDLGTNFVLEPRDNILDGQAQRVAEAVEHSRARRRRI